MTNAVATRSYDDAWRRLSGYLRPNWPAITQRGQFDLTKAFPQRVTAQSINVHLFFVGQLAGKLASAGIDVDLSTFSQALATGKPHAEVTLLLASAGVPSGKLVSYDSEVSLLKSGDEVQSALWVYLEFPMAIKICYLKAGAPVREPDGFPWHPSRQRKIVKLSPYKGDTQPEVKRRDLRI